MALLYLEKISIDNVIAVKVPKVGDAISGEENLMAIVGILTATPYDCMVELDKAGIDFSKINDFDLFLLNFGRLAAMDTEVLLEGPPLREYVPVQVEGGVVLRHRETGHTINWMLHRKIASAVRTVMGTKRNYKKPGNDEARRYMVERARLKKERAARKKNTGLSLLESKIAAVVCSPGCPYTYETVKEMTLLQLTKSFEQISKIKNYDNLMFGYYSGNVKIEKVPESGRTWIL